MKHNFPDIYQLQPGRFEEIIADIFKNQEYRTRLIRKSRDGGTDILLLEEATGKQIIVECKRYGHGREVGIQIVRELLGVQTYTGIQIAKIVTSSSFTLDAKNLPAK